MFCPQCGSTQSDELKYCKTCGSNLEALRRVMATRDSGDEGFDWSKTWVAEMFMSSEDAVKHKAKIEKLQGITPETKRRREIKAGIITASAGVGVMVLLLVLMGGIIASGRVSEAAAEMLSRVWIVGIIPTLVGAALIVNGMLVSNRTKGLDILEAGTPTGELESSAPIPSLSAADTNDLAHDSPFSVTDATTRHLAKSPRENR